MWVLRMSVLSRKTASSRSDCNLAFLLSLPRLSESCYWLTSPNSSSSFSSQLHASYIPLDPETSKPPPKLQPLVKFNCYLLTLWGRLHVHVSPPCKECLQLIRGRKYPGEWGVCSGNQSSIPCSILNSVSSKEHSGKHFLHFTTHSSTVPSPVLSYFPPLISSPCSSFNLHPSLSILHFLQLFSLPITSSPLLSSSVFVESSGAWLWLKTFLCCCSLQLSRAPCCGGS